MSANPFHLGWFMNGYRVHGWRDTWIDGLIDAATNA